MTATPNVPLPLAEPGIATAEDGVVVLDGPGGVAVTMTPQAATLTGLSLISAAEQAEQQTSDGPLDT